MSGTLLDSAASCLSACVHILICLPCGLVLWLPRESAIPLFRPRTRRDYRLSTRRALRRLKPGIDSCCVLQCSARNCLNVSQRGFLLLPVQCTTSLDWDASAAPTHLRLDWDRAAWPGAGRAVRVVHVTYLAHTGEPTVAMQCNYFIEYASQCVYV